MDYDAKNGEDTLCITVTVVENPKSPIQLEAVQGSLIPFLLGTAIKGW